MSSLSAVALTGLPEVTAGDDLAALLLAGCTDAGHDLADGDVVVVSSKVVSKAAGLVARPPGRRSVRPFAAATAALRDASVASETVRVVARRRTPRGLAQIVQSTAGPVMAAAGVDTSNTTPGTALLLPRDPDASARALRAALGVGAVVITDSWGRPWRQGQVEVAVGSAGLRVLVDHRGWPDRDGREMAASIIAIADEVAAAADLVRKKASGEPAVRVRGLEELVIDENQDGAAALVRPPEDDLFR